MEIPRSQMPSKILRGLLMICRSNSKHEISFVSLNDFDMFLLFIIYLLLLFFFCSTELQFINCFLSSTSLHLHSNIFFVRLISIIMLIVFVMTKSVGLGFHGAVPCQYFHSSKNFPCLSVCAEFKKRHLLLPVLHSSTLFKTIAPRVSKIAT